MDLEHTRKDTSRQNKTWSKEGRGDDLRPWRSRQREDTVSAHKQENRTNFLKNPKGVGERVWMLKIARLKVDVDNRSDD